MWENNLSTEDVASWAERQRELKRAKAALGEPGMTGWTVGEFNTYFAGVDTAGVLHFHVGHEALKKISQVKSALGEDDTIAIGDNNVE
ncbi:MAG: hypothetical protein J4432_01745 [DPANN group archaeon]|nr:hypothetical protein [DPANN group archaeon]